MVHEVLKTFNYVCRKIVKSEFDIFFKICYIISRLHKTKTILWLLCVRVLLYVRGRSEEVGEEKFCIASSRKKSSSVYCSRHWRRDSYRTLRIFVIKLQPILGCYMAKGNGKLSYGGFKILKFDLYTFLCG